MQRNATNVHSLCGKHPPPPKCHENTCERNASTDICGSFVYDLVAFGPGKKFLLGQVDSETFFAGSAPESWVDWAGLTEDLRTTPPPAPCPELSTYCTICVR
jgi:hypothetical protein